MRHISRGMGQCADTIYVPCRMQNVHRIKRGDGHKLSLQKNTKNQVFNTYPLYIHKKLYLIKDLHDVINCIASLFSPQDKQKVKLFENNLFLTEYIQRFISVALNVLNVRRVCVILCRGYRKFHHLALQIRSSQITREIILSIFTYIRISGLAQQCIVD